MKALRPYLDLLKDPLVLINAAAAAVFFVIVAAFLAAAGCAHEQKPPPSPAPASEVDAGVAPAEPDAGALADFDGGVDGGVAAADAGITVDAGAAVDAGVADAGALDAGAPDAGRPRGKKK